MKIGLIQEKQNRLYDFMNPDRAYTLEEAAALRDEMVEQNIRLLDQTQTGGYDLLVTSEAVNYCGHPNEVKGDWKKLLPAPDSGLIARFSAAAQGAHAYLVAGLFNRRREHGADAFYNSAFVFDRAGRLIEIFDKVHLAGAENDFLTPGKAFKVIDADFGRFGPCVCWDMQFPESARALALSGARLIVCPTWGWEAVYAHARAYENGIFVASAMAVPYWGPIDGLRTPSEVVSPAGDALARGGTNDPHLVSCTFDLSQCESTRTFRLACRRPGAYGQLTEETR